MAKGAPSAPGSRRPNPFEASTVCGVPQIARARGVHRWAKVGIFSAFLLGFLSQGYSFARVYLQYPVSLSVEIAYPDGIMMPALTLCMGYRFNKETYCAFNKDHCEEINETLVVKEEYRNADANPTFEELRKYGHTWPKVDFYNGMPWDNNRLIFNPRNPYRIFVPDDEGKPSLCFVINQQTFSINRSATLFPTKSGNLFFQSFTANIYFLDRYEHRFGDVNRVRHIAVHSPFVIVNPYKEGLRIIPETMVYGMFEMTETHLLPHPYRTDCQDYFGLWEEDHTRPLSRNTCAQRCIYEKVSEACGCFPLGVVYPAKEEFCKKDDAVCMDNVDIDSCYIKCKQDCVSYFYQYSLEPREYEKRISIVMRMTTITDAASASENLTELTDTFGVSFLLSKKEKIIYKYEPKHQIIEFFSYIGGLIGIWMGISLFDILDFLGISYNFLRASGRKQRSRRTTMRSLCKVSGLFEKTSMG